jgi:hypothetical protein
MSRSPRRRPTGLDQIQDLAPELRRIATPSHATLPARVAQESNNPPLVEPGTHRSVQETGAVHQHVRRSKASGDGNIWQYIRISWFSGRRVGLHRIPRSATAPGPTANWRDAACQADGGQPTVRWPTSRSARSNLIHAAWSTCCGLPNVGTLPPIKHMLAKPPWTLRSIQPVQRTGAVTRRSERRRSAEWTRRGREPCWTRSVADSMS